MKNVIVALLVVFGMNQANAGNERRGASLKLELGNYRGYTVSINGSIYRQSGNTLWLKDLRAGHNRVEIYANNRGNGRGNGKGHRNGHRSGNGQHGNRGHGGNRISANVYLEAGATTFAVIGRNRHIRVNRVEYYDRGYSGYHGDHRCMEDRFFERVIIDMEYARFERDRLAMAKNAIERHGTSARMVREMMERLEFEGSRLELAKFAYPFTYNKRKYYKVYDAFKFQSSIYELERYIDRRCR